jgi:D-2-hydroxyacid dehydrogenase (NADP+)
MNIILLQTSLLPHEMTLLIQEFPQFLFLSLSEASYKNLTAEYWERLEILYGSKLTADELSKAHHLRWVHCPFPSLNRLCIEEIEKQGNILVSNTLEENTFQVGEFVMGAILAFAKNLYHWKEIYTHPAQVWNSKWRDSMLSLKNKVFLQVGLNGVGTEITRRAKQQEMQVWGMQERRSFHPHCHKIVELKQMKALLPEVDVLCLSLSKRKDYHHLLQLEELDLMRPGSMLIILGSSDVIQEDALHKVAKTGKFRGILMDASYQNPIPPSSKLWEIPNMIITPEIAPRPKSLERQAFRLFLYNLRQYLHGNYKDMKNLMKDTLVNF